LQANEVKERVIANKSDLHDSETKVIMLGTQAFGERYKAKWAKVLAVSDRVSHDDNSFFRLLTFLCL
jgi:hypothetical protein